MKTLSVIVLSLVLLTGCECNKKEKTKLVYDVKCYENGSLIFERTIDKRPTVDGNNMYWRDSDTNGLVELTASCTAIPRNVRSLPNDRIIINTQ